MATVPLFTKPSFIAYRSGLANIGHNAGDEGPF